MASANSVPLGGGAANTNTTMNSTPSLNPTDTALLETFIPGYSMLSRFLISYLQIDLSLYIPYLVAAAVLGAATRYIYYQLRGLFEQHCISTAEIRHEDEVYNYLMYWLAQQPFTNRTTHFVAGTRISGTSRYYDSGDEDSWGESDEIDDDGNVIVDFDEYWAKATARDKHKRLRFTPSEGTHYFWFNGRPLAFIREKQENNNSMSYYGNRNSERLYISCIGRDPTILKELLLEAQRTYVARDSNSTVIYRGQKSGGYTEWSRCMARSPRALSTVVLDPAQKQSFIDDIKEYLHPRTRRWYSNRGIPYRRGYLLHGPPGTGKTSLCFAASGLLGLELYLLNLSSKTLDEDELMALFQELPRRCIVLLEDVDCAGMAHKRAAAEDSKDESTPQSQSQPTPPPPSPPEESSTGGSASLLEKQGVSLSGLLNVIDGVAACEGRILVMTTNHPEKLDPALIRPGRVDLSISFGHSTAEDLRELFAAIYSTLEGDLRAPRSASAKLKTRGGSKVDLLKMKTKVKTNANANTPVKDKQARFTQERVKEWANEFAARVPGGEFTPAEVQGYLLLHKTDPEGAIAGAEEWVKETREKKAKIAGKVEEKTAARPEETEARPTEKAAATVNGTT
ncbi:BCS1 and AAA domain-containing protein [Aspergillus lucknowensis]|uniref:BCS1 N terminal-domain-containing protein n=1 Tax=Aspergillus lucknowensis TaxID=176173 RepID=A0ABR4LPM0_9EURO